MKKGLVLLLVTVSFLVSAQENMEYKRIDLKKIAKKKEEASFFLSLGYQNSSATLEHNESSNTAGYKSLERTHQVSGHAVQVAANKEFLSKEYISLTLMAKAGRTIGTNKGKTEFNDTSTYVERLSGNHYGGGMSLNLNMIYSNIKIQPFIAGNYLIQNSEYNLWFDEKKGGDSFTIIYDSTANIMEYSLGVRFFNSDMDLMSYVSLDYAQYLTETLDVNGNQGGSIMQIDNTSDIERRPLSISVGIGIMI